MKGSTLLPVEYSRVVEGSTDICFFSHVVFNKLRGVSSWWFFEYFTHFINLKLRFLKWFSLKKESKIRDPNKLYLFRSPLYLTMDLYPPTIFFLNFVQCNQNPDSQLQTFSSVLCVLPRIFSPFLWWCSDTFYGWTTFLTILTTNTITSYIFAWVLVRVTECGQ